MEDQQTLTGEVSSGVTRRRFFGMAGTLAGVGLLAGMAACKKDDDDDNGGINLGSGDVGVLNYAYALEQLEAAFYIRVVQSLSSSFSAIEQAYLTDVRDHEIAHREFFKAALGSNAIQALTPNFSIIDFGNRTSVLSTAKAFEDLGVSAYNGAGKLLSSADNLTLAGKIVSVEARHAAAIRDMISNGSFADSTAIDNNGLDLARTPAQVLAIAGAYINEKLNANNLPNN